jgi:hypothetical protein
LRGPVLTRLLTAAALAPSGHNTQPWRFSVEGERITILPDPSRRLPVVHPDDHALYISLGCAVENLMVAARGEGYHAEVDDTGLDGEAPVLTVHLHPGGNGDGYGTGPLRPSSSVSPPADPTMGAPSPRPTSAASRA